jgi:hypothetical protein
MDTEGSEVNILTDIAKHGLLKTISIFYIEFHSEEDRRTIDLILKDTHSLIGFNGTTLPHIGIVCYLLKEKVDREIQKFEFKNRANRKNVGLVSCCFSDGNTKSHKVGLESWCVDRHKAGNNAEALADNELYCLEKWCYFPVGSIVVEIGDLSGNTAKVMAKRASVVMSVNTFDKTKDVSCFYQMLDECGNVNHCELSSLDASKLVPEKSLDAVYIDKNSGSLNKENFDIWLPKIKIGGIIGGNGWLSTEKSIKECFKNVLYHGDFWMVKI